jgi:hypothetical protein
MINPAASPLVERQQNDGSKGKCAAALCRMAHNVKVQDRVVAEGALRAICQLAYWEDEEVWAQASLALGILSTRSTYHHRLISDDVRLTQLCTRIASLSLPAPLVIRFCARHAPNITRCFH